MARVKSCKLKALIAADSDQIIGFTAVGAGASELIAVVQMAMLANLPYTALRDAIRARRVLEAPQSPWAVGVLAYRLFRD